MPPDANQGRPAGKRHSLNHSHLLWPSCESMDAVLMEGLVHGISLRQSSISPWPLLLVSYDCCKLSDDFNDDEH